MNMSTEMIVALSIGALGLVLGILALVLGSIAKSGSNAVEREMTSLRQEITQTQSADWLRDREIEGAIRVQSKALRAMTKLREELNVALRAQAGRVETASVVKAVSDAGRRITTTYDEIHAQLGRAERATFHRAKEFAHEVLHRTRAALDDTPDPSRMSEEARRELLRMRAELIDLESTLRDARVELVAHGAFAGSKNPESESAG